MSTMRCWTILLLAVFIAYSGPALTTGAEPTIRTLAGTGGDRDGGDKGPAAKTSIGNPFGVELGPEGALYICEVTNHRVRRLDLASGELTTVAGTGVKGYSGDGGPATKARLNEPYEIRFDRAGNMFFVEMQNHVVRRVDAKTGQISTIAGSGTAGFAGDGGPATRARLRNPHSIALDGRGGMYIADIGNHRIRRVDLDSGIIRTIAGTGGKQLPADGALAEGNPLVGPRALFIDGGVMWIALREGHSIWRLDLGTGRLKHVAGTGRSGYSGDGGPGLRATFNGPKGIAVGPKGDIYVADTENHAIRRIDGRTHEVSTLAGSGPRAKGAFTRGIGDDGPAAKAILTRPHGVCVGPDGTVYIGDSENHRVRMVK